MTNSTTDTGREEIPQLLAKGVANIAFDSIRAAECLEIIRRPPVEDANGPGAFRPSRAGLQLEIIDAIATRIRIGEPANGERNVFPLGRDASAVVYLDVIPK